MDTMYRHDAKRRGAHARTGDGFRRAQSSHTSAHTRRKFSAHGEKTTTDTRKHSHFARGEKTTDTRHTRFAHGGRPKFTRGARNGRKRDYFDVSRYINRNPIKEQDKAPTITHRFGDFGFTPMLDRAIRSVGFEIPSPIQDKAIKPIMDGRDVIGLANTGTGKTAAFLLPLIQRTITKQIEKTLILAPTRELAIQIQNELRSVSPHMNIFSTVCVGGMPIRAQIRQLTKRNQFVIGTPGRILDLIEHGHIVTADFSAVVLDEADRMLDMGFINDMRKILGGMRKEKQTLFFSATMSEDAKKIVHDFLHDPITVSVVQRDVAGTIAQDVIAYEHHNKFETLTTLLADDKKFARVLIFGEMKHSVEKLSIALIEHGISAVSIHGNKSQDQRRRALDRFKKGNVRVMVATDVAARGIHVDDVSHVVNYDMPLSYEDYVHRIGRTGRAGKGGQALTFVSADLLNRAI